MSKVRGSMKQQMGSANILDNFVIDSADDDLCNIEEHTENLVINRFLSVTANIQNSKTTKPDSKALQLSESQYTNELDLKEITDHLSDKGLLSMDLEKNLTANDDPNVEDLLIILNKTIKNDIALRKLRNETQEECKKLIQLKASHLEHKSKLNYLQNDENYKLSTPQIADEVKHKCNLIETKKYIIQEMLLANQDVLQNPKCVEILDDIKKINLNFEF